MIRTATPNDLDRLAEIVLDAFPRAHRIPEECWKGHVDRARQILPWWPILVFENGGRVEGFVSIADQHITDMFVASCYQRRGIGAALMQRAKQLHPELCLEVYAHNEGALAFYLRSGFVIESRFEDSCAQMEAIRMKWTRE